MSIPTTTGMDAVMLAQFQRVYAGLRKALLDMMDEPLSYGAIVNACGALVLEAMLHDEPDLATRNERLDRFCEATRQNATNVVLSTTISTPESDEENAAFVRKAEAAKVSGTILKPEAVPDAVLEARKDAFNDGLNQLLHRVGAYGDIPLHPREVVLKFFITGQILALTIGAAPAAVRKDFETLLESARRLVLEGNTSRGAPS